MASSDFEKRWLQALANADLLNEANLANLVNFSANPRLKAAMQRNFGDSTAAIVDDPPVGDYVTDFDARQVILAQWRDVQERNFPDMPFSPSAVGILMVAPINVLRDLDREILGGNYAARSLTFLLLHGQGIEAIKSYLPMHYGKSSANTAVSPAVTAAAAIPTSAVSPMTLSPLPQLQGQHGTRGLGLSSSVRSGRNRKTAKECKRRDGGVCIISGTGDPHAAHIFPHSACQNKKTYVLERVLRQFWGEERAAKWADKMKDEAFVASPQNLISLNPLFHHWFDTAAFAFKPLPSDDPKERRLQFHWLQESGLKKLSETLNKYDPSTQAGLVGSKIKTWGDNRHEISHRKSGLPVLTGQVFTIRAENPDDLPDFDILQLQWDLLRVCAIAGAGEMDDDVNWDFDDDDADVEFFQLGEEEWYPEDDDDSV